MYIGSQTSQAQHRKAGKQLRQHQLESAFDLRTTARSAGAAPLAVTTSPLYAIPMEDGISSSSNTDTWQELKSRDGMVFVHTDSRLLANALYDDAGVLASKDVQLTHGSNV